MTFPTGKLVEVGSCPESHYHIQHLIDALAEDRDNLYGSKLRTVEAAERFLEENAVPQMCVHSTVEQLRDAKVMPLLKEVVVVPKEVWNEVNIPRCP